MTSRRGSTLPGDRGSRTCSRSGSRRRCRCAATIGNAGQPYQREWLLPLGRVATYGASCQGSQRLRRSGSSAARYADASSSVAVGAAAARRRSPNGRWRRPGVGRDSLAEVGWVALPPDGPRSSPLRSHDQRVPAVAVTHEHVQPEALDPAFGTPMLRPSLTLTAAPRLAERLCCRTTNGTGRWLTTARCRSKIRACRRSRPPSAPVSTARLSRS